VIAVDTNVLARALAEDDPVQTPSAQRLLAGLSETAPGFVSLTVLVELHWVLDRVLRLPADTVEAIFDGLMEATQLEIEDGESVGEALEHARQGADFADALIHATGRLYGVTETVTFDRDAAQHFGWRLIT
jgi:predicted nucleic-acid-binding protein